VNDKPLVLASEPVDMSVIAKLRSDYQDEDGSFLVGLVEAFVDETRALQQATQAHVVGEIGVLMAQAAHRLKSAAATLGAHQVVTMCQQLEAAERASDKARAASVLAGLLPAIVRARAVLKRISTAASAR
jgi:HPt (histidine-containing phosphotransfer) domain-containing protein